MEHPLDKNNLDDLLRHTLGEHEELPSDGVWQGIERDLPEKRRRRPLFWLWWVLGLTFLGSGLWLYRETAQTSGPDREHANPRAQAGRETAPVQVPPARATILPEHMPAAETPALRLADKTPDARIVERRSLYIHGGRLPGLAPPASLPEESPGAGTHPEAPATPRPASPFDALPPLSMIPLETARNFPAWTRAPAAPLVAGQTGKNVRLGVRFMPFAARQSIGAVRQRPVRPGTLPVALSAESDGPTTGWEAGLTAAFSPGGRWSIHAGVGLRRLSVKTVHHAKMRRIDGQSPGAPDSRLRFRYTLNTPTGGYVVDVRMEQVDTAQQFPSSEPVSFELHTRQTMQYLTFPLSLKYRIGNGRWGISLQSGVSANILTGSALQVDRFVSRSVRFRPDRFVRPLVSNGYLRSVSLDALAGIGFDFELSEKWKISVEPVWLGQIVGNNNDPYLRTSGSAFGLNAGLSVKW